MRSTTLLLALFICFFSAIAQQTNTMQFTENKGQVVDMNNLSRSEIKYTSSIPQANLYFRNDGFSYVMVKTNMAANIEPKNILASGESSKDNSLFIHRIDVDFAGANEASVAKGVDEAKGYSNFYMGGASAMNVKQYKDLVYENIYNNIDLVFHSDNVKGVKYDIVIKPGGNPSDIKIKYTGADALEIKNEELRIKNSMGDIVESMPKVYQSINGKIVDVKAEYKLNGSILNFKLGTFNAAFSLTIDPWITYIGGSGWDYPAAIAKDNNGEVIVTGITYSNTFPVTAGAFQTAFGNGATDVFVIKYDANGNRLWATYYGGNDNDNAWGIATDANNNIFITGNTHSANFPVTGGAFQTVKAMHDDVFIVKLNATGTRQWAGFYGGDDPDYSYGIDVDLNNDVYIAGRTQSNNLPVTPGTFQTNFQGITDAFLAKFDGNNGNRLWGTYLGGIRYEGAFCVKVHNSNNIIVSGYSAGNFPVTVGAYQTNYGGGAIYGDAFVSKFNGTGNLLWATYLGGSDDDAGFGIDTDISGNVYAIGNTASTNFPFTAGAFQTAYGGGPMGSYWGDAYIVKFTPGGTCLWSTYLGGSSDEEGASIVIDDATSTLFVIGDTYSPDFPATSCAFRPTFQGSTGSEDNFIARFDLNGNRICSGFIGGTGHEDMLEGGGPHLVIDGAFIYFATATTSNFPVTPGAYQTTSGGGGVEGVVGKLCAASCGKDSLTVDFNANNTNVCAGAPIQFSDLSTTCDANGTSWLWHFPGASPSTSTSQNPAGVTYSAQGSYSVTLVVATPCGIDSAVKNNYIVISNAINASINGNNSICGGTATTLTAAGGGTYVWNDGSTTSSITVMPTSNTTFSVAVTNGSCVGTATINITVNQIPVANAGNDTAICKGQHAILTATGGNTFVWNTTATTASINVSPNISTSYTVTTANGNCSDVDSVNIVVLNTPLVNVSANITIVQGTSTTLSATGGGAYLWSPSTGISCVTCQNIIASPTETTLYYVIVTDANGCTTKDSVLVTVEIICADLFLPNAFSPDGDRQNDVFYLYGNCVSSMSLSIYNRWGEVVFETKNITDGWDGKFNNELMDAAVFSVQLKAILTNGDEVHKTGSLYLVR